MTKRLIEAFPSKGGEFQIEPDASSGSYFWAAGWLNAMSAREPLASDSDPLPVSVNHWPTSGWQIDADFPDFLPLPEKVSREGQLGDSIMTAIVLAADQDAARGRHGSSTKLRFTELERLRVQECERVMALRTELEKCGARVTEIGDELHVEPTALHGAEIETYNDHRMAMCFATLGLKVPGIRLKNPACVKKTFPNFFQKLAAPPPDGLGAAIFDVTKNPPMLLRAGDLFAE
jgi:3-phosphoshikimate 1-carboxyvinyltransferase